jgi:asparagine synthase (glutamine-hydrolysing)
MCGILIVIGKNSKKKVENCIKKLLHRGPDDCRIKTVDNISFGFTRLAINDTHIQANQPFEFQHYIGVSNAEIYNHKELKNKYNLNCNSTSDAEVILPLYHQFKENILPLLDGFYASIIYNKKNQELVLMRDYIGKKPLFFAYDTENQYICSELKILPKIEHFEIIPKGICKIVSNSIIKIKKHSQNNLKKPSNTYLYQIIEKAVFKRIVDIKDYKIGVFLSGGLDSAIVAFLASKLFPNSHIYFYSISDPIHPDYEYIKIMHKALKLSNNTLTMIDIPQEKEFISIVKNVVYHTESYNPSIISNGIGTYLLSKQANKDGIKVVLTGDGADEMFMGYYNQQTLKKDTSWKTLHQSLINDLTTTELRRIDLAGMANSIEIRCPFLDINLHDVIYSFQYKDFFGDNKDTLNKNVLRKIFEHDLPQEIYSRPKVSFDVGSGLQKLLVDICKEQSISEEAYLKNIWNSFFEKNLSNFSNNQYFHSYPAFNDVIPLRGNKYCI